MANGNDEYVNRSEMARVLAALETLTIEVRRLPSVPPPPAAQAILKPTRQEQILAWVKEAAKEQKGISTSEIGRRLGLNRQQVATALYPLENALEVVTVNGRQVTDESGRKHRGPDMVYVADILAGWN
jgi:hypothetical protein